MYYIIEAFLNNVKLFSPLNKSNPELHKGNKAFTVVKITINFIFGIALAVSSQKNLEY